MSTEVGPTELQHIEVQAMAHVLDWNINERRYVDANDPDIRLLIDRGLLVVLDDELRAKLPTVKRTDGKGCACGH